MINKNDADRHSPFCTRIPVRNTKCTNLDEKVGRSVSEARYAQKIFGGLSSISLTFCFVHLVVGLLFSPLLAYREMSIDAVGASVGAEWWGTARQVTEDGGRRFRWTTDSVSSCEVALTINPLYKVHTLKGRISFPTWPVRSSLQRRTENSRPSIRVSSFPLSRKLLIFNRLLQFFVDFA